MIVLALERSGLARRLRATLSDPVSGHLLRGSFVSMGVRVAGLAIGFLSHMLLSRTLGATAYGQYSIALGWALVLVIPARLGMDNTVLRYATIYVEEDRPGAMRGLVRFTLIVLASTSALIGAGLFIESRVGLGLFEDFEPYALLWVAAIIFPLAALGVFSAILRTTKRILASQAYEQLLRPVVVIAGIGGFAWAGAALSAERALMITAAATVVALAGALIHFFHAFPRLRHVEPEHGDRGQWLALSWPLFVIGTIQEVLNQADVILLGYLADPMAAGHFAAALRLSSLVIFALVALTAISGPMIAWAHRQQDKAELARIARLNARLALAFSIAMSLFLALIGRAALGAFGPGFEDAYPALLVLLAGGIVNAFTGSVAYLMTMTGKQNVALLIFGFALVASLALNILLIPRLGVIGAAIASTSATAMWNFAMLFYVRRKMGIDASAIALSPRFP